MVDTLALGASEATREGSSPSLGTSLQSGSHCSRRMGTTQAIRAVNSAKTKSVYLKGEKRKNVKIWLCEAQLIKLPYNE